MDAVLEGSALLVGNRVRMSVQLVSARADETLWADRYDRELDGRARASERLAETVAREIAIQLTPDEARALAQRGAVNPEAHLEFLKCRHSTARRVRRRRWTRALRHARRALELDPNFALAWSALADCQIFRAVRGMAPPAEAAAEATAAATSRARAGPIAGRRARLARPHPGAHRRPRAVDSARSSARSS